MQRETPPDFEVPASDHEAHDWANVIGLMPELPSLGQRWTVLRKAAVIEAVRGGWQQNLSVKRREDVPGLSRPLEAQSSFRPVEFLDGQHQRRQKRILKSYLPG